MSTHQLPRFRLSRRALLGGMGAASALAVASVCMPTESAADSPDSDFGRIRDQWRATLVGRYDASDPVIATYVRAAAAAARPLWTTMEKSADRSYLWRDLDSSTVSAVQRNNIGQLRTLALALKSPGSSLAGDPRLKADLISAMDWFLAKKYTSSGEPYDNWWDWEIGIPLALNDFCVLLYDDLEPSQIRAAASAISHFAPDPTKTGGQPSTGANRNWACAIAILRGALSRDADVIDDAKSAIRAIFPYSSTGDNFYSDGGFVQHESFAYTGGYGLSLVQYLTYSMVATSGTRWRFNPMQLARAFDWTQLNFRPWIYAGALMDMNRGRNISRFYETDHRTGRLAVATLLQLAAVMPGEYARTIRSQCKGWIVADRYQPFFLFDPIPIEQVRLSSIAAGRKLMADASIRAARESTSSVVATSMARAVHRRPGFAYAVAMDTATIKPYESANQENLQGWYTGEGGVYLYLPNQVGHWADAYWPTADKYRVPGTTVSTRRLKPGEARATENTWAGGAVLDGATALGMSLNSPTLRGRKSWLCIGDLIVCLGAGITGSDGHHVETVIEQRNTGEFGKVAPVVDGDTVLRSPTSNPMTASPSWVWIPGTGGYVFPAGGRVHVMRNDRCGRWTEMDTRGVYDDSTLYRRRFITLWFDHGVDPVESSYAYFQLPGAARARTANLFYSGAVRILANTSRVQAVTMPAGGATVVNFWSPGALPRQEIQVDRPASVVLTHRGNEFAVGLSDPTGQQKGSSTLRLGRAAARLLSADPGVTVLASRPTTVLRFDVAGAGGKTLVARFKPGSPPAVGPGPGLPETGV